MIEMRWTEDDLKRMLDYLRQKVPIFEEVRRGFNIGDCLGLAVLPEYSGYAFDGGVGRVEFSKLPADRTIVKPVCKNGGAYIISVYFMPGAIEQERGITLNESYFLASDEVLTGFFAHECAEYLLHFDKKIIPIVPIEISLALREKNKHLLTHSPSIIRQLHKQCQADLLASMFGYHTEMLAYLKFSKERISAREDFSPDSVEAVDYRPKQEMLAELQARIDFIESATKKET